MFNFLNQRHYAKFHYQNPPKRYGLQGKPNLYPQQRNELWQAQKEPFTNSFVIMFPDEKDSETVYWLAYSLWKSNFWHQFLIGSVIPFLRITDFKKDFDCKVNEMLQEHELHQKRVQTLRLLEQKENQLHQNILLINEMRRAILNRYCIK